MQNFCVVTRKFTVWAHRLFRWVIRQQGLHTPVVASGWKRIACIAFLGSLSHFSINFVAVLWMDLMPLSERGSTVRRNLDDGITEKSKLYNYSPRIGLLPMDFRAREISSSCFLAVEAVDWWRLQLLHRRILWLLQISISSSQLSVQCGGFSSHQRLLE